MRAAAKAVIETLLIVDVKAGSFLVMEGATRLPFTARFGELGRAHNHCGQCYASTQLVFPLGGYRHDRRLRVKLPLLK